MKKAADKSKPSRQELLNELTEGLEQAITEFMDGDTYKDFLSKMSRFHSYSLNNQILIATQRPDATDPATGKPVLSEDGKPKQKIVEKIIPYYKIGYIFDISQTDGEPLPEIAHDLEGELDHAQKDLKDALLSICPVPVHFQSIPGESLHGYYDREKKEIAVDSSLSEKQALKTLIHEMAHAKLHNTEYIPDHHTREVQAESVAYVVCQYFGLDTSDYSFGYISSWSTGKDIKELKQSLEIIRNTSNDMISEAEQALVKMNRPSQVIEEAAQNISKRRCR